MVPALLAFLGFSLSGSSSFEERAQSELFSMTTYNANKELTSLAYGVTSGDGGGTWHFIIRNCLECFPSVTLLMSGVAKGLRSLPVKTILDFTLYSVPGVPGTSFKRT